MGAPTAPTSASAKSNSAHSSLVDARIPKASPLRTPRASSPCASSSTASAASSQDTSRQALCSSTRYAGTEEHSAWREVSWKEAAEAVEELAHGLLALGVRKGDAFAILASTRLEWALFDFALALVGAVGAPIYMNSSPKDVAHVVEHSDAVGILCEDEEQRAKLGDATPQHVLTFADLDDLRTRGRDYARTHPNALAEAIAAVD